MDNPQANNPLHGKTLESIVIFLVEFYGFEKLGKMIRIKCFNENPDVQSSLKFLRKTPWARKKVEDLFLRTKRN
ncbi:MAG: VF530 family protein [Bacteroidota bacterium]